MNAEKFIKDYTRNCGNIEYIQGVYAPYYHPWITPDDALSAVVIEREEMMERACEYIDGLIEILNDRGYRLKKERIIGGLKQAMNDE